MGLKRPWLEQGLALSLGFSPEEAEAFWITYNLKFNRNHVGYVDRAANRGGLAAEPSAMDLRVIEFYDREYRNKCTKTIFSRC